MSAAVVSTTSATPTGWRNRILPLARSVLINFVAPYIAYRLLAHWFAPDSPAPLMICAIIPAGEFVLMLRRRKVVDAIALLSLSQLAVSIAITLLSGSAHRGLWVHALQSGGLGLVFAGSALIGRPLIRPLARQAMAGDDPERRQRFDIRAQQPQVHRRFTIMTMIWAAALCTESAIRIVAVDRLPPASYILLSNILGYGTIALLIWGSMRFGRYQMAKDASR